MAENAAAVSLPPVRLDPTQGSSPALNTQDPWAAFPTAPPPAALSQPISLDEIRAGQVKPASQPSVAASTPEDPWAAFPKAAAPANEWESFPKAGELKGYDLTKLKATKVEDLVKDKSEFNPVEFYAKNTEALLADPAALELVEKAYEQREKEKMSAKEFFLKANPVYAILHPIESAKTAGKIVKGGAEFIGALGKGVGQVFATGGEVAGNISSGDLPGAAKGISEAAAAFDTAQQHWVTTITSKLLPRPDNIRERLAYDADFKRREIASAAGNGELAKALGTDQEGLKASGVTLDTDAIQKLSVIEDPMFLVPIGGAIGVVGRGGKFLLGRAASPAVAEAFAKTVNGAMDIAVGGAVKGTGNAAGKALEKAGAAIEKSPELMGRVGAPLRTGGIVHALSTGDLSVLASTLAAPVALKYSGKALQGVGRGIQAAAPVAGKLAVEGAKGAAEGAALSVPLFIGSTPEERDSLLGMVGGAGLLRAGVAGTGMAGDVAARAAQEKLAKKIYEPVSRGPIKDSPIYGTDGRLDSANVEQTAKLPPGEQSVLNWAREFFRDSGIEIYALDKDTFRNHVPDVAGVDAAEGFFTKRGERIGPDGTRQPVVQVLLNRETNGLGHELYHAFKSLDPRSAQVLEAQISKTWTPEEQAWIADTYNSALNGGKPKSQWAVKYDEKQILEEAAAEVFGRVLNATDLSGVRPSVVKRASEFASRTLEKMGYPLAGKALPAGPGVSALGVRPGTGELKVARDFLTDITKRVSDGTLSPPKPGGPLAAGPAEAISRRQAPAQPRTPSETTGASPAPQGATPPPLPVTPPESAAAATAPAAPEPLRPAEPAAPNIRVTPAEQADFAGQRAKVTNSEQALKAASPEQAPNVQAINDSMAQGHAVEIVHKGVIREGGPSPEAPVARGTRRAEQEAAYVAEAMGAVPDSVREPHQKLFFGTRWIKGGKQLTARSVDKALANIKNAVDMAAQTKTTLPYEVDPSGKLTESGWAEAVQDLKDYWTNQDRGFRGDGQALSPETRTHDIGQSIPPQDPAGPAAIISPERTDFLNLVQGLNIPAAVTRQTKGKIPGNVKGQLLAEAQGRKPAAPSRIAPEDVQRQTYKPIEGIGTRDIAEVNPLRNDLRAKGAPVENLIEVTENIKAENIESVTPRPDVTGRGGSTDITRAGFSVSDVKAEVNRRLEEKRKLGNPITEQLRKKTQQEVEFDLRNPRRMVRGEEAGLFSVKPSKEVRDVAEKAAKASGVGEYKPSERVLNINEDLSKRLADFYEAAESKPNDPAVKASYDALIDQVEKQGQAILDAGYKIEPYEGKGEPYKSSAEMIADVRDNKHMFFLQTAKEFGRGEKPSDNPMLRPSKVVPGQVANDVFRWVHDFFGHAKEGYQFGPKGELNAWKSHSEMFTPEAQGALAAETLAQNSWVNYGKHLRDAKGNVAKKGEPGFVPATERPFGEQKNIVIPDELIQEALKSEGSFSAKPTGEVIKEVFAASPEEWQKYFGPQGSLTRSAYELGLNLKNPVELEALRVAQERAAVESRETMDRVKGGDFDALDAASAAATKTQFFREAIEAATDTGSAAGSSGWRKAFPEAKPPFAGEAGKFSVTGERTPLEKKLEEKKAAGVPITDIVKRKAQQEVDFEARRKTGLKPGEEAGFFSVRRKGKKVEEDPYAKYNVPEKAKTEKPTGWVLPNGEFVGLDTDYHQTWLGENSDKLNKDFGTSFAKDATIDDRMTAVNKGFVRVREYNGKMTIEASQKHFKGKTKAAIEDLLSKHAEDLDSVNVHLLNDKGFVVDQVTQRLFDADNPRDAALSALERLKPESQASGKGPSNIQRARAMGGDESFSVAAPEKVPTDKEVTNALSEDKKEFVGAHRDLEPGTPVGLRIDIPAFTRHGTYVVTVHEKAKGGSVGKRIGYDSIATVNNPTFFSNERGAQKIKEGAAKFPIATVEGEFNPSREVPKLTDAWTEVGFNPDKHSYFYEKGTDEPVVSGSQAVSVGNSVFVKDAVFGNKGDS